MTREEPFELAVCEVCIHLLANGEFDDGTDAAEVAGKGMERSWGPMARHLVPGSEDLGHSRHSCQGCGSIEEGERFRAFAIIPQTEEKGSKP